MNSSRRFRHCFHCVWTLLGVAKQKRHDVHLTYVFIVTSSFARIIVGTMLKRGVTSEEAGTISKRKEKDDVRERKEKCG